MKKIGLAGIAMLIINMIYAQYCTTREWSVHETRVAKIDTISLVGIGENLNLWANGKEIRVGFLNGSAVQQEQIIKIAKQWEQYANITFRVVPIENAHVRILLANTRANYTFIGTEILKVNAAQPNMQFDRALFQADPLELKRVVLHQFGHILGMTHEHNAPQGGMEWNQKKVRNTFAKFGWKREDITQNIFNLYTHRQTNGFFYDAKSIMHWWVPRHFTTNGYFFGWNDEISEGDKFWASGQYPFSKAPVNKKRSPVFTI